jgi:hypothetical protein
MLRFDIGHLGLLCGVATFLLDTLSATQFFIQIALAAYPGPSQKSFMPSPGPEGTANGSHLKLGT